MSEFSPTDAALEGLRISRERPLAVLWWWAANIVAAVIQIWLPSVGPFQRLTSLTPDFQAAYKVAQANPADTIASQHLLSLFGQIAPAFLAFAAVLLLIQMVLSTAVLRAVLRPAEQTAGYLRVSMDEVRQLGLALLMSAAFLAYLFLVTIVSALIVSLLGGSLGGGVPGGAFGLLISCMIVAALIYPAVRLSLAPAMTLADGRISFLRAWALTEGRFWPLFGAYMIAFAIAGVLWLAINQPIVLALKLVAGHTDPAAINTVADLLHPLSILLLLLSSLLSALLSAVITAPMASAFRQITGRVGAPLAPRANSGSPWS